MMIPIIPPKMRLTEGPAGEMAGEHDLVRLVAVQLDADAVIVFAGELREKRCFTEHGTVVVGYAPLVLDMVGG